MKSLCYSLIVAAIISGCDGSGSEPKKYSMKQFMDNTEMTGVSFSPDGKKLLVSSQASGIFNAVAIDVETGEQKLLTKSTTDAVFAYSYFPADERFIFSRDKGGNEISHLYVQTPLGEVTDLIGDSTARAQLAGWSPDRKKLYFSSNSRDHAYMDLYRIDIRQITEGNVYLPQLIYRNEKGLDVGAISPDEKFLVLTETMSTSNSNLYLYDTQSNALKLITPHEGEVFFDPQYFTPDGRFLIYLTDENSQFRYLVSYNVLTGERKKIEDAPWDIAYSFQSRNGKYRVVAVNRDARNELKIYDRAGNLVQIPKLPAGDITGVEFSDDETQMAFYLGTSSRTPDLYHYMFTNQRLTRLTSTLSKDIQPDDLVEGEVVRFNSYDSLAIPCIYYKPKGIPAGTRVPALLFMHGGPGGQSRLSYSAEIQFLVNHGYAVLAVNNRGSSGYGKSFFMADDRKHGDADLKDCIAARGYLATLPEIDPEKIGIMGGSYGGYLTMAALTYSPETFKVGVNLFGVTNWLRTLKSIPPWWGSFRQALYLELGDPFSADSTALYNKSPLFFADRIRRPFIVLQGKNDPRVLQAESDEIVAAARKNGVEVEYVIFPDEGHGFVKNENNIRAMEEVLKFLDKHLTGAPDAEKTR